jgi:hypothetical protein
MRLDCYLVGPIRPRPMGTSTRQPDPGVWQNRPGRVAGAAPRASEMAHGSLPHQRVCSQRWGTSVREGLWLSAPNRPIIAVRHKTAATPTPSGWRQPPSQSPRSRLNQEDVHPAHCSPQRNRSRVGRESGGHPVHSGEWPRLVMRQLLWRTSWLQYKSVLSSDRSAAAARRRWELLHGSGNVSTVMR